MKRIINSTLFVLVALLVSVLFVPSVMAAEPTDTDLVTVSLKAAFGSGNVLNVPISDVNYGDPISIEDFGTNEDFVFDFWIVNGVVREDLPQAATFLATDGMELIAVFHPVDESEFYVVFIDSNGKIEQSGFVAMDPEDLFGSVTAPSTESFDKPGYVVAAEPWVSVKGSESFASITEATVFQLAYTINLETTFVITKPAEATISNANPLYNEIVTVESSDEDFVAWLEDGQVVSYDPVYKFTALRDRTLTVSTDPADVEPVVSLQVLDGDDELRSGHTSYLGQVYLPAGATLIEWGLLGSNLNSMPTYGGENVTLSKSSVIHPLTNEFLRSIPDANDFEYVRAYAVVKVGETISTVYSYLEEEVVELIKLPAPIHGIGHQPRPVAHLALGPYSHPEGANGGFTGHAFRFINNTTSEEFIWKRTGQAYNAGSDSFYTEANLLAAGIVLTPGNYTIKYYAMGNGTTTSDSDDAAGTVNMTIQAPALAKPVLSIDGTNLTWSAVTNATSYEVYVDGVLQVGNTSPFDLSSLVEPDIYVLKVVAKASGYQSSEETINYLVENEEAPQLETPINLAYNSETGFLSWDAVTNAVNYTVTMDGVTKNTASNSYDLGLFFISGEYEVTVIANGDEINYLDSNASEPLLVNISQTLTPLNAATTGDFNGELWNSYSGGHRHIVYHAGHAVFNQAGWSGHFFLEVYASNGTTLLSTFTWTSYTLWFVPNQAPGSFGSYLVQGNIVHIILIASDGSGYANSAPLIVTLNA